MKKALLGIFFLNFLAVSCAPLKENGDISIDLNPPVLVSVNTTAVDTIVLSFSEEAFLDTASCAISPALTFNSVENSNGELVIKVAEPMAIGEEYKLMATVADTAGNSTWLIVRFYGFNPVLPVVLINEFITQGSSAHPDLVELKVMSSGNMGGITFYHGSAANYKYRFVFPAFAVKQGDFILLHTKPENIPQEKDETEQKDLSGGLDASPLAFDFWIRDGSGLAGSNGAVSLYTQPGGAILDAVLYSARTSASDTTYRGFGSNDLLQEAEELVSSGGWKSPGELVTPEDCVNPELSTATRSISRSRASLDTDTKNDFHIVPNRKSTFGKENTDEVYTP